jgi:hypothetical protein
MVRDPGYDLSRMPAPHTYCDACGSVYPPATAWPRAGGGCGHTTYRNPVPVGVVLQPVGAGLLVVRRGSG